LLLHLVNKILVNAARTSADLSAVGKQLLERLRAAGPTAVDDILGEPTVLEISRPQARARAVRATIEASTGLLGPADAMRFAELGVFAEDETIPFGLAARLWRATSDLDDLHATQLCARLSELSLVSTSETGIGLHDVIRDFLRFELGNSYLTRLHKLVVDSVAADLPSACPPDAARAGLTMVAWWELRPHDRYMWEHLIEHLLSAE
jgi:hypothetical protein